MAAEAVDSTVEAEAVLDSEAAVADTAVVTAGGYGGYGGYGRYGYGGYGYGGWGLGDLAATGPTMATAIHTTVATMIPTITITATPRPRTPTRRLHPR